MKIPFKGVTIRFEDYGEGFPVVLLHGYLESLNIWDDFTCPLCEHVRIITIDLPGHGESGIIGEIHSMETMAEAVKSVLDFLKIEKCMMTGHSMGGYVTLAFLEKYPERLAAFSLFHSKPQADTEMATANRIREIELVKEGKKELIYTINIPKSFANDNLEKYSQQIEYARKIASATPGEGIIAALNGMMARPSRETLLANTTLPFLYILGKKDNYLPYETILSTTKLPLNTTLITLESSGHMGFIEEKKKCLDGIIKFIKDRIIKR
jgi:pimeloyl-ACP methyl ester carboxylesterase